MCVGTKQYTRVAQKLRRMIPGTYTGTRTPTESSSPKPLSHCINALEYYSSQMHRPVSLREAAWRSMTARADTGPPPASEGPWMLTCCSALGATCFAALLHGVCGFVVVGVGCSIGTCWQGWPAAPHLGLRWARKQRYWLSQRALLCVTLFALILHA